MLYLTGVDKKQCEPVVSNVAEMVLLQNKDLKFFGLGETFLFSCLPESRIYPWVGWTCGESHTQLPGSKCLYLAANLSTIVVGGG